MGGDGRRDGELMVMDGAALRRWTARRQLDGEGRRNGDSTTRNSASAMAMSTRPAVGAIKANAALNYKMKFID
jgi:hypothetical protein